MLKLKNCAGPFVAVTLFAGLAAAQPEAVKELLAGFAFWSAADPWRQGPMLYVWHRPSTAEVEAKKPLFPEDAEAAKRQAADRLLLLMKQEVIPQDVVDRMVALDCRQARSPVGGLVTYDFRKLTWSESQEVIDSIVAAYQVDDLAVYWRQIRVRLDVAVQPPGREKVSDLEGQRKLCEEMAQRLFGAPDSPIPSVRVPSLNFRREAYGASGYVLVGKTEFVEAKGGGYAFSKDPELVHPCYSHFRVATDGRNVRFWGICTNPYDPPHETDGMVTDWF